MATHDLPENGPTPIRAELIREPQAAPRRKSFWGRLLTLFLVLGLAGSLLLNALLAGSLQLTTADTDGRVQEKFYSHDRQAPEKVAIISVEGTILDTEGFVKHQIDRALKDKAVRAVVLRVNSPGGSVSASDFFYHHLQKLRTERKIPIVVSMGGLATSGGYYVAMSVGDQTDSIFAEPATWTGSIGVVIPHYNLAEMFDKWGIKEDSIASHRLKTMGSFAKPMTEEERKILQSLVDDAFGRFKSIVKSGRPKFRQSPDLLDKVATGQVFTADQAKQSGLIDQIGFLDDAVDRAITLAQLDPEKVQVIKYKRETGLSGLLFGSESQTRAGDLSAILDLAAPRAYYLYTWLPALIHSRN
jgi:protease-4